MKKKGIFFAVISVFCLFMLTACGGSKLKDYAGTYNGEYTKFVGDSMEDKDTSDDFYLELKEDGTGIHHRGGENYSVKWEIDKENFKMTETFLGISIEYTGTLKDGKLDIFNGDKEDIFTVEYVYTKK